ncbi:hypothetical protein BSK66_10080 [Paenibacillus odorifer]|uniref:Uncharacterized protein n=1 Tax=Paenibacillus odorifer TaxID=189426 RepID=A0A1R0XDR5_9BACL|nr:MULTISPECIES: hypothetical protein [Paenibacillus]ETT45430.1 hypothetical protein C171_32076 [Paenibacillus sp. FSL H8-237]OMD33208.1 hypothetical protein BJP51_12665 [Paenibacillus odorifer]OME59687.1 hypothetical protein BSK66_10080 [Paenibacillus odorifer]
MQTVELTEQVLKSKGWAYQFDLSVLADPNEDTINEQIRNVYLSALRTLSKQKSKKLLKGPFYVWICQKKLLGDKNKFVDGFALIITPFYQEVVGRDVDPLVEAMWQHKGFIRIESAIPILEGAVPLYMFEDGQAIPIELDAALLSRLNGTFEEHQYMLSQVNPGMTLRFNPYENDIIQGVFH